MFSVYSVLVDCSSSYAFYVFCQDLFYFLFGFVSGLVVWLTDRRKN